MRPRRLCPQAITTPSRVETGIGTLEFTDGYPTVETAATLRDHLDYLHGVETFMNTVSGGLGLRHQAGVPGRRHQRRRCGDLLGVDGLPDAGPDRERRHRLLLDVPGPVARPAGAGDPRRHAGAPRRHVVPLGHRLRSPRSGPRPGRHLPGGRPWLRRAAARGRLLRPPLAHQPRAPRRPCVHQREPGHGPRPDGRPHQGGAEDLPLRRLVAWAAASAPT